MLGVAVRQSEGVDRDALRHGDVDVVHRHIAAAAGSRNRALHMAVGARRVKDTEMACVACGLTRTGPSAGLALRTGSGVAHPGRRESHRAEQSAEFGSCARGRSRAGVDVEFGGRANRRLDGVQTGVTDGNGELKGHAIFL